MQDKEWSIIKLIKVNLLIYACIDYTCQIICQMPLIQLQSYFKYVGFRKIWDDNNNQAFDYKTLIQNTDSYNGLNLNMSNFMLQTFNCFMICCISLQTQIFDSYGYNKFIT